MEIIPQKYYLLVALKFKKTSSMIATPDGSEVGIPYGVVLAVGPKAENTKIGDLILFNNDAMIPMSQHNMTALVPEGAVYGTIAFDEGELTDDTP